MTKKDKKLLLKDLCARLPYVVIVHATIDGDNTLLGVYNDRVLTTCEERGKHNDYPIECIKPYLRPMSSMTEEERSNLRAYCRTQEGIIYNIGVIGAVNCPAIIDFLLAHHLDYRGLIEKGLALEAPKDMYKT